MSAQDRLSIYELIKAFFGTLGILGTGVLLLVGPEPLREEIPDDLRVGGGMAMLGVGFLFAVAVILSGQRARWAQSVAVRVKGLLLAVVMSGLVALGVLRLHDPLQDAWVLSREGQPAQATVVKKYGFLRGASNGLQYQLECEGHVRRLRLPGPYSEGQSIAVLRSVDQPTRMLPAEAGDGFLDLIAQNPGHNVAAWCSGLGLLAALLALLGLKRFLLGKGPRPEG